MTPLLIGIIIYFAVQQFFFANLLTQNKFSQFGNFLAPIISLITTSLLIYITIILNKRDAKRSVDNFLFQYRTNVFNQIVKYAATINSYNTQWDTKSILNKKNIVRNRNNMPSHYLYFMTRYLIEEEVKTKEEVIREKIQTSTDEFYADMLYDISEIKFYIENFPKTNRTIFKYNFSKSDNYNNLNKSLTDLEKNIMSDLNTGSSRKANLKFEDVINKFTNFVSEIEQLIIST